MAAQKTLLVVLGATGNQGGSVISYFLSLSPSHYKIRGVTRDPSSPKAVHLTSLGVEMVAGDFDNPSSLDAAFEGASVIFSVTNYWLSLTSASLREKASASGQSIGILSRNHEAQQNRNIIDAAAKVGSTLERFIFSSMAHADKISGGKYAHVYHFDGKGIAEEYGKTTYPELWEKTNVFYAGFYLENYLTPQGGIYLPKLNKSEDKLVLYVADPLATTPMPMYSSIDDTGAIVHAITRSAPGKKILGVNEWLSLREFGRTLAQVLGKNIDFVEETQTFDMEDAEMEKDHLDMMGFCIEFRYDGGKVDKSIVQRTDLELPVHLASVKEWCEKQDWEKFLQIE